MHDAPGRLEEQRRGQEHRVFQEAEASLDFLLVFPVGFKHLFVAEDGPLRVVGGDDEAGCFYPTPRLC